MKGESVQAVYQDIRRLLALGFPGESGDLFETIGRDAFLTALADPALRIRVLDQHPRTLDDALAIVVRMEAYGPSSVCDDDNVERKRVRVVSPARETEADRRIRDLENRLECQNKEIQRLKQTANRGNDRPQQQPNHGSRAVWNSGVSRGGSNAVPHCGPTAGPHGGPNGGLSASQDGVAYCSYNGGSNAVPHGGSEWRHEWRFQPRPRVSWKPARGQ